MAKYGMAIDLEKCAGCGACAMACKTENNTEYEQNGQRFNWADYHVRTLGTFNGGNVGFGVIPTLCNHCTNAPCVTICPVGAMTKDANGITMHNDGLCIGCQQCQTACPYSDQDIDVANKQYSVLSYNDGALANTHIYWNDTTSVITGCSSTPSDIVGAIGFTPPCKNDYTHSEYTAVRPSNVTEKCYFCDHRVQNGDEPYCVDSCPTGARVFGDQNDPLSALSILLNSATNIKRLKNNNGDFLAPPDQGTSPNVFYLNDYGNNTVSIAEPKELETSLLVYPNPAKNSTTVKFDLAESATVTVQFYDISGKMVQSVMDREKKSSGTHEVKVNVTNLSAGTYICRVAADEKVMTFNFIVK